MLWRAVRRFPFEDPDNRNRKLAARAALLALLGASALFGVMLGLILVYSINLPQMTELERYHPSTTTELTVCSASSGVIGCSLATPRIPSVPKSLRGEGAGGGSVAIVFFTWV